MAHRGPANYFWFRHEEDFTTKAGWLLNILPTTVKPKNSEIEFSAVNLFFMEIDGSSWRVTKIYEPYIYAMSPFDKVAKYLENKRVRRIEEVHKLDIGKGMERLAYKFVFASVEDLKSVRADLRKEPNIELREADVPYYQRFCIDFEIRVGNWYIVNNIDGIINLEIDPSRQAPPQPRILAFDIECAKQPLQFPNAEEDEIMMISYVIDGQGFLVVNRHWFSKDIESFEYSPLDAYCLFTVWNCRDELSMLETWFEHIRSVKPHVMVTFNGDMFDWPYVARRTELNHLDLRDQIGYYRVDAIEEVFSSQFAPHIDCFRWVQRDSYLPAGSQGLKAVTKAKLQYNPLELDPEDICPLGVTDPQRLANYSVSDAYATFYLYLKYVHPFIFSLTTVLPVNSDDCLRKGTGTLCECLLMARAYAAQVFFPNKCTTDPMRKYEGHLMQSETYVGGRVEALQSGIFRSDIPTEFSLSVGHYNAIIDRMPNILNFVLETEMKIRREDVVNYDEIYDEITTNLKSIRDAPNFRAPPIIIHLDVAAMYPNIILTNRLQPTAIVDESICAQCTMRSDRCQRKMTWTWRGEVYPATDAQSNSVMRQLESENVWHSLSVEDQTKKFKERLSEFCRKTYQKTKLKKVEHRESIVCMKSHSFYVETVRSFRDRRYEFKDKLKEWNKRRDAACTPIERDEVKKMIVLYDSLQLAHKCLLNTFYGYVMRGGARWRSIEMAGVVTEAGAQIIQKTREIVQGLGKGLELDTDGIWAAFPPNFPMSFDFKLANGEKRRFSFPCSLLNENVDHKFANDQYHEQDPVTGEWTVHRENSIFFELDGPYHAMFLPAAKEEGKKLKKRYAVFNANGHITELKGFEIKRRGEWKMIKIMQSDAFRSFMKGSSNQEVYDNVAQVCKQYLMILQTEGRTLEDDELLDLMSESSTMSKNLSEYGGRKSPAATTAKRLSELLGEGILQGKGLKCQYIISKLPRDAPIAARAIPVLLFQSSRVEEILGGLRRWCGDLTLNTTDFRDVIDWDYYRGRLHGALQKVLVIPSYLEGITIKDFDVPPPDWVIRNEKQKLMMKGQTKLDKFKTDKKDSSWLEIERPRVARDELEFTPYQKWLMKVKRNWRSARKITIERPIVTHVFSDWRII
jgi:DNA polymerase epsilon subunit 1